MVTGIILAGGRSSRMGRDKALLPVDGQMLIELVIKRLRPYVERLLVVAHPANAPHFTSLPVDAVLTDFYPGHGPLMGIYTGLMAADTPLSLVVPCDMPWIKRRLIARLVSGCQMGMELVAGRHPTDGVQPFPLACRASACRTIGRLLDRGERSLQALLRQPGAHVSLIEDPALWPCFTNVNTLADYANLHTAKLFTSRP